MDAIDKALADIEYCQDMQFRSADEHEAKGWEAAEAKHEARYLRLLRDHADTCRLLAAQPSRFGGLSGAQRLAMSRR